MRVLLLAIVIMLATACNKVSSEGQQAATPATASKPVATAPQTESTPAVSEPPQSLEGTTVEVESGAQVSIISVGSFDKDVKAFSGLIAVEGRVAEVFPGRGAFVLVDYDRMAGCATNCCPQAEIPVRLTLEEYTGDLPAVDTVVVIVGDITVTATGYDLKVLSVQSAGEVILSRSV